MTLKSVDMTPEDEAAFNEIREAATKILSYCEEHDDIIEVNRFLAELEAYPTTVLRIVEVE